MAIWMVDYTVTHSKTESTMVDAPTPTEAVKLIRETATKARVAPSMAGGYVDIMIHAVEKSKH